MRLSTNMIYDEGTKAEMQVRFSEGDKNLHTLTVFVDDSDSYDGSRGIRPGALRQALEVLPQMQEVILEALKSKK